MSFLAVFNAPEPPMPAQQPSRPSIPTLLQNSHTYWLSPEPTAAAPRPRLRALDDLEWRAGHRRLHLAPAKRTDAGRIAASEHVIVPPSSTVESP